jgi:hypothetical protein
MDIKTFQGDFIEAIFGGDKAAAISHVIGDDTLTAEQRLGIYSGSVHGILTQALGVMFPTCKSLVGDDFFNNMCKIFIDKNPPNTCFFAEYGAQLPEFIKTFEYVKDLPYLYDVARLEWIRQIIWHEEKPQTSDFSGLATLSEDEQSNVVFTLSKRMRLIKSDYRIDDLWFAHQPDNEIELENMDINQTIKLIIKRDKNIIKISTFSENEIDSDFWDFLNAISKGDKLESLAEQFGESLGSHLSQGIQGAWIQSFTTRAM